ncbi:hypothetical protein ACI65C_010552, partial [Semiaphis heraclei]
VFVRASLKFSRWCYRVKRQQLTATDHITTTCGRLQLCRTRKKSVPNAFAAGPALPSSDRYKTNILVKYIICAYGLIT